MGIMTIYTAFLHGSMDDFFIEFFFFCLVANNTEILAGSGHGHGFRGTMGIMAGNTNSGANWSVDMGAFSHICMTVCGAGGSAWGNAFKIEFTPAFFMTFFTVEWSGVAVDIEPAKSFRCCFALFLHFWGKIINLYFLFIFAGGQNNIVGAFGQGDHYPEGFTVHCDHVFGCFVCNTFNLDLGDGRVIDNTC